MLSIVSSYWFPNCIMSDRSLAGSFMETAKVNVSFDFIYYLLTAVFSVTRQSARNRLLLNH